MSSDDLVDCETRTTILNLCKNLQRPEPHDLAALCNKRGVADEKWIEEKVQECQTFSEMEDEIQTYKLEKQAEKNGYKQMKLSRGGR